LYCRFELNSVSWFQDCVTDTGEAVGPGIFWVMAEDAIIPAVSAVSLVLNGT